jgi:hypothetical protein
MTDERLAGSQECATTGRSDKKNVILPNGRWLFFSLMDEQAAARARPLSSDTNSLPSAPTEAADAAP